MAQIEIIENITLPEKKARKAHTGLRKSKYPFASLNVDAGWDSYPEDNQTLKQLKTTIYSNAGRKRGVAEGKAFSIVINHDRACVTVKRTK